MTSATEPEDRRPRSSWFGLLPADERQALRVRRFLMGSASSLLVVLLLFVFAWFDALPGAVARTAALGIGALIVTFLVAFRSGANLHAKDASLTAEQIGAAILVLAFVMSRTPASRGALIVLYLMPLMFGILRLRTRRLFLLAALALFAHGAVVWLSANEDPQFDLRGGLLQLAVLSVVLPWFALMGGYVNRLRTRLSDSNRSLAGAFDQIAKLASHDALTGVFNRRHLLDALEIEQSRAQRLGSSVSVCLLDIDHFKSVNDDLGHAAGDAVLRHFAAVASADLRPADIFGRYGGEEFLLVLPSTDAAGGLVVCDRICKRVGAAQFPGVPSERRITVSTGLAVRSANENAASFVARADAAMYAAKKAGRNRVVLAD